MLKFPKFDFGWGSSPDPTGGAYSASPDPLAGFKGPISKGKEGKGRDGRKRRRAGKGKEGRRPHRIPIRSTPMTGLSYLVHHAGKVP